MESPLQIRKATFTNGEQFPVLFNRDTGIPLFYPNQYLSVVVRTKGDQAATLEVHSRALKFLYNWGLKNNIDIEKRVKAGILLDLKEIELLTKDIRLRADGLLLDTSNKATPAKAPRTKVAYMEHFSKLSEKKPAKPVSGRTAAIRLWYIRNYLDWMIQNKLNRLSQSNQEFLALSEARKNMLDLINARIPSRIRTNSFQEKLGLTRAAQQRLFEVIDPESPENPWKNIRIRYRNELLINLIYELGLRKGEALVLRLEDINLEKNLITIHRNPDDPLDTRRHKPQTKTLARELPILNLGLRKLLQNYIFKYRALDLAPARRTHHLFVETKKGTALTIGAVNDIFRTLKHRFEEIPSDFSAHTLRHTWNDRFSELADEKISSGEWTVEKEKDIRCQRMGWVPDSKMSWNYTRRFIKETADKASIDLQEKLFKKDK